MNSKEKAKKRSLLKKFLPYYRRHIGTVLLDLFCAALTTLCDLALPMIVRTISNAAIYDIASLTLSLIGKCAALYLILRLVDTAAYFYMSSVGHIMGTKIETDMRRDFFTHLQKLSFSFYDNTKIGTLMSRITNDLFDVTEFAHHCPEEFFIAGIKIIASFFILFFINKPLTLIIFAILPVMVVVLALFNHKMRETQRESRRCVAELNAQVEDSLLGNHEVKAFANEETEIEKFEKGNQRFLAIKKLMYRYFGGFQTATRCSEGILYLVVVIIGALFIKNGQIDAADMVTFLLYVTTLLSTVRRIVEFAEQFQRGMTGIERFTEIMETEPEIVDRKDAVEITSARGDIVMDDISFHYTDVDKNVLTHLNLHIREGENVALVGPSGGGKTTLCSLIPRFYEITEGRILLDGRNIRDITLSSLRRQIGIVQQDVYLFSGNVRENIAYGKPGATDEEIERAARLAGAHEFIMDLPNGYDTYVGERGVKLSGGQKQRISIARVFLKDPPILILDEATSALDNESERLIQESLEKLAKGRTTLTIAHRLTTIRGADTIVVLTEDGIAETGTHEELMNKGGIYSELYRLYSTV